MSHIISGIILVFILVALLYGSFSEKIPRKEIGHIEYINGVKCVVVEPSNRYSNKVISCDF